MWYVIQNSFFRLRPLANRAVLAVVAMCVTSTCVTSTSIMAQEALPDFRESAETLQSATVTIRVEQSELGLGGDDADDLDAVEVFTGVCLGNRLIAAPMLVGPTADVRVTLVDGEQGTAFPVVVDEFTGLALLRLDRDELASLPLTEQPPRVGGWVLSAAAWGIERPVISYGIVSGVDRRLAGTHYPPLLLCDLRTTDTSSGSPVIDPTGNLVGIVIAASTRADRGWTYAVPATHLARLMRTLEQHEAALREEGGSDGQDTDAGGNPTGGSAETESDPNQGTDEVDTDLSKDRSIIVIQHQRPTVGMVLEDDGQSIKVAHLSPEGPAEKAGIQEGDIILGVDGVRIRNVYQAVLPTYHCQPGDVLTYQVNQNGTEKDMAIVLGGDVALPASSIGSIEGLIDPKVRIQAFHQMLAQITDDNTADSTGSSIDSAPTDTALSLLERAIINYQTVIAIQHEELLRHREERANDLIRLDALEEELKTLREQVKRQSEDGHP